MMSTVIDCADPTTLAPFWRALLGYEVESWSDGWVAILPEGGGPKISFQRVPESKSGKNRLHIDLQTRDVPGEVSRAERLGAQVLYPSEDPDDVFVTMADPEGSEFCVCLDADEIT